MEMDDMKNRLVMWGGMVAVLLAYTGCGDSGTDGPCEVSYAEPILEITGVADAGSGEPIEAIEIWDVVNDRDAGGSGSPQMYDAEGISEVEGEGGRFLCEVPCGFGNQGGVISFEFEAPGYQASSYSVEASYGGSEGGGCPVTYTDGTKITLELEPEE